MIAESNLSLGIVGVGRRGADLIRSFDALEGCTVSQICDSSFSQLMFVREWFPHIPVTANYEDLLLDPSIQAIVVATPVESRYLLALASLEAGKHVMIEAPPALDSRQANDLVEVAASLNRVISVGHTAIYRPIVGKMQTLLAQGRVGELSYMATERSHAGAPNGELNVIWDLALQDVAVALYLAGERAESVTAAGRNFVHRRLVDAASIRISYESGRFSQHSVSWLPTDCRERLFVAGSEGSILFDSMSDREKLHVYGPVADPSDVESAAGDYGASPSVKVVPSPRPDNLSALTVECANFFDCVRSDEELFASGKLGRDVVKVLEAADLSIRQGSVPIQLA